MENNKQEQVQIETPEQELARLRQENARLKQEAADETKATIKISDKGCISLYGLGGRFPVTMYRKQWLTLMDKLPEVKAFIENNKEALDIVDQRFQAQKQAKKQVVDPAAA